MYYGIVNIREDKHKNGADALHNVSNLFKSSKCPKVFF